MTFCQISDYQYIEKRIKELVFTDAISNGNIEISNIECYEYFTQKLILTELESSGFCFNNFIFVQILYTELIDSAKINQVKDECVIKKHSTYNNLSLIAFSKKNGKYYKLIGFRHSDFKWMIKENLDCYTNLIRNNKFKRHSFLNHYEILGFNLDELVPKRSNGFIKM